MKFAGLNKVLESSKVASIDSSSSTIKETEPTTGSKQNFNSDVVDVVISYLIVYIQFVIAQAFITYSVV